MKKRHGGDWYSYQQETGKEPLDFSASISPFGMPESVKRAIIDSLDLADRYPDPDCRKLRGKLSGMLGVSPKEIVCGNGASEVLDLFIRAIAPGNALLPVPCFSEYEASLMRIGTKITYVPCERSNGFSPDASLANRLEDETDLVILGHPANPGGTCMPFETLSSLAELCTAKRTFLLVDECFLDYVEDGDRCSLLRHPVFQSGYVILIRAFTKYYAMAGLRLGYGICCNRELMDKLDEIRIPWSVSTLAQNAGIAAIQDMQYAKKIDKWLLKERTFLQGELTNLGCDVIEGRANFLLFYSHCPNLDDRLRKQGILIRDCSDYEGLGRGWYRVSIRTREDNLFLLDAMKGI